MVLFEQRGHVATLTLDHPEVRNAIDSDDAKAIEEHLDHIEADDSIWVSIITGTDSVFCSGANIKAMADGSGPAATERGGFAGITDRTRSKPLIAAINGPALAGGCEIAMACDLIVASTTATFGLSEVKRSMVAAAGGLFKLPRSLPRNIAMEMAITGDAISVERAAELGLVNDVVEPNDLMAAAQRMADRICANAPLAVRESRRVLIEGLWTDAEEAKAVAEQSMSWIRTTDDFAEGSRAFLEKRAPQWLGR